MDYQDEYLTLNKDLHDSDSQTKSRSILHILPKDFRPNSIIDIACGSGKILIEVSKKLHVQKVVGIDVSYKIIDIAKQNDKGKIASWIPISIFDYQQSGFDLVLAIDIVEHIENDRKLLDRISSLGSLAVIKVPIEDNPINRFIMWISRRTIDPWKETEKRYGHIHHYSLESFINLMQGSDLQIERVEYIHLPRRNKVFWEVLRILFLPLWFISKKKYIQFNGGFVVILVKSKKYGKN